MFDTGALSAVLTGIQSQQPQPIVAPPASTTTLTNPLAKLQSILTGGADYGSIIRQIGGGMANMSNAGGDPYLAFAQGFGGTQTYATQQEKEAAERAAAAAKLKADQDLAMARLTQDQSQFDASMANNQSQFDRNLSLDQQRLSQSQSQFDRQVQMDQQKSEMDRAIEERKLKIAEQAATRGDKPPTGYTWKDPNDHSKGLDPIPGGPATEIPAELAARVGLVDNFQKQLPDIRKQVSDGKVTGVFDRGIAGWFDSSEGAQTYRQIQSGVDALQRMLTGAGMNQAEAAQYAQRYLPSYTDDADSLTLKLDQLEGELEDAKSRAMQGREPSATTDTNNDPLGIR